jgi:alpha-L-rhamnosidase
MGDNMAGFATLSLPRSALVPNQSVSLKYAEVLKSDGSVDMAWCAEGAACKCSGINCANQTDTFIPGPPSANENDDTSVEYTPTFTYHGFRYVQVEGLAKSYTPTTADLTGLFVHSAVRSTGNVSFSHPVLDGVQKAIVQTQKSNLHFHPTDCPQREKRGWTGDGEQPCLLPPPAPARTLTLR